MIEKFAIERFCGFRWLIENLLRMESRTVSWELKGTNKLQSYENDERNRRDRFKKHRAYRETTISAVDIHFRTHIVTKKIHFEEEVVITLRTRRPQYIYSTIFAIQKFGEWIRFGNRIFKPEKWNRDLLVFTTFQFRIFLWIFQ